MKAVVVIPARYGSSRLPWKPFRLICGKPMICRVFEAALSARKVSEVIVATDDGRIAEAIRKLGGRAMLTEAGHPSGTDRVAEAAARLDADVVVNVQGDEPLVDPAHVDLVVEELEADSAADMTTLCTPIRSQEEFASPDVVKTVFDRRGYALYFSRLPIPFGSTSAFRHVGVYGYRRRALMLIASVDPVPEEAAERLEQLRPLVLGLSIKVLRVESAAGGVDTRDDLNRVRREFANEAKRGSPASQRRVRVTVRECAQERSALFITNGSAPKVRAADHGDYSFERLGAGGASNEQFVRRRRRGAA